MPLPYAILQSALDELPLPVKSRILPLDLPVVTTTDEAAFILAWEDDALTLVSASGERLFARLARPARLGAKQPFTRALAAARNGTIIEATAGFGSDTLKLALVADEVISIERHPVVYAMLVAALHTATEEGWSAARRVVPVYGDAIRLIPTMPGADVIYIDPMFPPKRKRSALPPKPVRMLRELVGGDPDESELFAICRKHATKRVVVKRPLHAPPMEVDPLVMHEGKVVRYEVYAPKTQ